MEYEKEIEFVETPLELEFTSTAEKILALNDALAEDIILENIKEQLEDSIDTIHTKINYISLFRGKYSDINKEDDIYDEEYLKESLEKVALTVGRGIKAKFEVELGEDLDFTSPAQYLYDMETLYEFLFIRQYENILEYLKYKLYREKPIFLKVYGDQIDSEPHSKDLFVIQSRKKFKNRDDVVIMTFLNEIISDIINETNSAYDLFTDIVNIDKYEEYNNRMGELLINYGNKIVLNNDSKSAKLYFKPLDDPKVLSEIRNQLLINYLEGCEINE